MSDSTEIKTAWRLEMASPDELQPKRSDREDLEFLQVAQPSPEFSWFLHQAVGTAFRWGGREHWRKHEWVEWVNRPAVFTWVMYASGAPAGYVEYERQPDGSIQIAHLGLLPSFIGQGLGGHMLTLALEQAWADGATVVWLKTCSHDHPNALKNYQARGMRIVDEWTGPPNAWRSEVLFTSGAFLGD